MDTINNIEKSVWKNKLFRQDKEPKSLKRDEVQHPDVVNIQQKIKKINKRKKYVENFNNIQPLKNVYEEPVLSQENNIDEPIEKNIFSDMFKCSKEAMPNKEDMQENIQSEAKENFKEGFGIEDVSYEFYNFIFGIPNSFEKIISKGCYTFTKTFSNLDGGKPNENNMRSDSKILRQIIYISLSFPICIYVTYNWIYLLAYYDKTDGCPDDSNSQKNENGELLCRPANDSKRLEISFSKLGEFSSGVNFMFDFAIMPLWVFDKLILGDKYLPSLFPVIPWKIITKFIILFYSLIMVYGMNLFGSINNALRGTPSILGYYCGTIIIGYFIYKLYMDFLTPDVKATDMKVDAFLKFIPQGLFYYVFLFFYYVFRLIIAVWSINVSSIIVVIYFWIHSLFGMAIYGGGLGEMGKQMENIDEFVNKDLLSFKEDDKECAKPSIVKRIIRLLAEFLYDNIYLVAYILVMGTNISNALSGLKSTSLKQVISCLIGIQIIIACLYIWNNLAGKKKPETKGTPVNKYNAGLSNESGGNGANISSSKPPVSPLVPSVSPSAPPLNKSDDLLSQTENILSSSGIGESSINSDNLLVDVKTLMENK
jgi:hypothetical protein